MRAMTNCVGNLREIFFCLSEGLQNMNACSNHHSRASNHSSQASSQLFRASKKPSQVCNNPSQLRLKPGMDGWTDKQTKVSLRSTGLCPLTGSCPACPPLKFTIMQSRALGIADHRLPLSNRFSFYGNEGPIYLFRHSHLGQES